MDSIWNMVYHMCSTMHGMQNMVSNKCNSIHDGCNFIYDIHNIRYNIWYIEFDIWSIYDNFQVVSSPGQGSFYSLQANTNQRKLLEDFTWCMYKHFFQFFFHSYMKHISNQIHSIERKLKFWKSKKKKKKIDFHSFQSSS